MSDAVGSGPQVTYESDTITVVAAIRELISTLRTADAPVGVLQRAAALVDEAADLVAPYRVDGIPAQTALRFSWSGGRPFESRDPAEFFPYSPVVGPLSAIAPPITLTFDGERTRGTAALAAIYAGPPGTVHGGGVALVFDELLGVTNVCHGLGAFTGTLTVRYERPTPIETELEFESWVDRTEGRKVFTVGTISAGGQVTARAEGLFIQADLGGFPPA